ncbi:MAG: DUF72 domain-containing protein [Vicinamibacterales bacterium]
MRIHVGTSGYNYPEWRGSFYPEDIKAKDMFAFYARAFRAVEINYTFYRMPTTKTTTAWESQAPDGFRYVLKAPRRITHDRRLKDCADLVGAFVEAARVLGDHRGPLLFQLAPTFRADTERLAAFLDVLPADVQAAFEFRHDSWLTDETYRVLSDRGAALCIADVGERTTPVHATARHGYFRLRDQGYEAADLERWAETIAGRAADWDDAWVFFKHEDEGKGAMFARDFTAILERRGLTGRGQVLIAASHTSVIPRRAKAAIQDLTPPTGSPAKETRPPALRPSRHRCPTRGSQRSHSARRAVPPAP